MSYRTKRMFTREFLSDADGQIDDKYIFRCMAMDLVYDMPFERLERMFRFDKLDPDGEELKELYATLAKRSLDPRERIRFDHLRELRSMGTVEFHART